MNPWRHALGGILLSTCSCSLQVSHTDGSVTHFGIVNLREASAGDATLVHTRRYGVMLDAGASDNGVAVGYDNRLLVRPPDDTLTEIDYVGGSDPVVGFESH